MIAMVLLGAAVATAQPAMVTMAPVQELRASVGLPMVATVEAVTRSEVAAEEEGLVAERMFDEGDQVKAGQILARLDVVLLQRELEAKRAEAAAAEAEVARASLQTSNAKREFERVEALYKNNVAPEKEYLDATTDLKLAEANEKLRAATLEQRRAELARLETMIQKSTIRAPFDGLVARRWAEVGGWIGRGGRVAEIVQIDPLYVRIGVPETLMSDLLGVHSAEVSFDAMPGRTFEARLDKILPEADAATRTIPVRLILENDDGLLRPGFFARVVLKSSTRVGPAVPRDAVVRRGTAAHVVAATERMTARIVPVEIVATSGNMVWIKGEIKPGDLVVTRGNESIRPDQQLIPLPGPGGVPQGASPQGADSSEGGGAGPGFPDSKQPAAESKGSTR